MRIALDYRYYVVVAHNTEQRLKKCIFCGRHVFFSLSNFLHYSLGFVCAESLFITICCDPWDCFCFLHIFEPTKWSICGIKWKKFLPITAIVFANKKNPFRFQCWMCWSKTRELKEEKKNVIRDRFKQRELGFVFGVCRQRKFWTRKSKR